MDDQRKDPIGPKGTKQSNRPKQLQTDNLPTDDVENVNNTNKGKKLQLLLAAVCFLRNRKDAVKDPEAQQNYFT